MSSFRQLVNINILKARYLNVALGKKEKLWNSMSLIAEHSSEVIIEDCEDKDQVPGYSERLSYLISTVLFCLGVTFSQSINICYV